MPAFQRSALIAPAYEMEGDPSTPSNNSLMCIVSVFRKLAYCLTEEIDKFYQPKYLYWSHKTGMGTECVVAFAAINLSKNVHRAVLLDLNKAYDLVPMV